MKLTCYALRGEMTRPGTVRFERDEPVCMIFPVPHGALQNVAPEIVDLDSAPEVRQQTMDWKERRDEFLEKLSAREPQAMSRRQLSGAAHVEAPRAGTRGPAPARRIRSAKAMTRALRGRILSLAPTR
jgi:hypothetical protein